MWDSTSEEFENQIVYSDVEISSDVEAELYSQIYYLDSSIQSEQNVTLNNSQNCEVRPLKSNLIANPKKSQGKAVNDWKVIGKSYTNSPNIKVKSKAVSGPFSSFIQRKSSPANKSNVVVMTDSSECEVLMEILPPAPKSKPNVEVVKLSSSSDEEYNISSESLNINESLKLNLSTRSDSDESESESESLDTSKSNFRTPKNVKVTLKRKPPSDVYDEFETPVKKVPHQFNSELRQDGSLSISKELWSLNPKDKFKSSFRETDYYREKSRLNRIICHNCKEAGHLSKHCKKAKRLESCYLCGNEGHNGDSCPNPACSQCLRIGHTTRQCLWSSDDLKYHCSICNLPGHLREECPDIWRRFYLTTNSNEIVQSSRETSINVKQYCCNCGRKGHAAQKCSGKTMDECLIISSSKVFSYSNPSDYVQTFSEKDKSKEDRVRNTLFDKKKELSTLANEKYQRTLNGRQYHTYRGRTRSDEPHKSHRKNEFGSKNRNWMNKRNNHGSSHKRKSNDNTEDFNSRMTQKLSDAKNNKKKLKKLKRQFKAHNNRNFKDAVKRERRRKN